MGGRVSFFAGYKNPTNIFILVGVLLLIYFTADTNLQAIGIVGAYLLGRIKSKKKEEVI